MPTEKLYWDDPFAMTFACDEPASPGQWDGKASIILPRTIFYPEAGGQLGDTGTLTLGGSVVKVTDTQVTDDGVIHHIVSDAPGTEAPDARASGPVYGAVDRSRRVDHMAHHTAQHMLSSALLDVARAETVSARLGRASCTIDLDVASTRDADLARAEDLVNAVIRDDVTVRAFFPTAAELATLKLRRAPKVTVGIRVVDIDGFDLSPCGGTHCTRTGQIGVVRVAGAERYKGKTRISFHAAARAVADARAKEAVLAALTSELTSGPEGLGAAIAKLKAELQRSRQALGEARIELARMIADQALAAHPPGSGGAATCTAGDTRIVILRDQADVATLRVLAGRLAERDDVVAICASPEPGAAAGGDMITVVQRGAASRFDCGAWLKALASAHGGRGGGRPERAEGRLPLIALTMTPRY